MPKHVVFCCLCTAPIYIEQSREFKIEGTKENYYICDVCLENIPNSNELPKESKLYKA